jgi:ArsR family transcriptional regulator, arsenate/arsenite/antimonite-responsive transcriptional repressor
MGKKINNVEKNSDLILLAEKKAGILKALAHPVRITIFETLAAGEKQVGELVELLGTKEANTSRHLAVMRNAGLLSTRKEGLNVYYSVKMPCLLSMLSCIDEGVCTMADEQGRVAELIKLKLSK